MEKQTIRSTSLSSAQCADIVLREKETTRLVFRPELVENPNLPAAGVKGTFVYQRKSKNAEWQDAERIALNSLKAGEGYKLELHSAELLKLHQEVGALLRVHAKSGVPMGESEYVRVDSVVAQLAALPVHELRDYLAAHKEHGSEILGKLLRWATETGDLPDLLSRLVSLGPANLQRLNAAVGLERLKRVLAVWDQNRDEDNEGFWQATLAEHAFLFEHVFAWPTAVLKDKAYVGGKSIDNTQGKVVDFLLKNRLTHNVALLEIKTPATKLLGGRYREGVHNVSGEVTGSVLQVLDYKASLMGEWNALRANTGSLDLDLEPQCVVIVGSTQQLSDAKMRKSLELFRASLNGVAVLCFDELFEKTKRLIVLLEEANSQSAAQHGAAAGNRPNAGARG